MHSVTTAISAMGWILRHRSLPLTLLVVLLGSLSIPGLARAADPAVSPQALQSLQQRAEQGDAQACFDLAGHYINGDGLPQSDTEALRWFGRAAAQGLATAQYNVGVMYATGRGVEKSLEQAARWYRVAAEQGHAEAQFNLGTQYAFGIGVERNLDEAVVWLDRAAEQGMAQAQYNLAVLLEQRNGAVNRHIADLYIQAAAQDYPPAQERLADLRALHILPMPKAEPKPPAESMPQAEPKPPGASAPPPVASALPESVNDTPVTSTPAVAEPAAQRATPVMDENYTWLMAQDPEHVTLHLGSFPTAARAQAYVQTHKLTDQAYALAMDKDGRTWHGLFYGIYTGLTPGRAARAGLPAAVRSTGPWLRNVADIQSLEPIAVQRFALESEAIEADKVPEMLAETAAGPAEVVAEPVAVEMPEQADRAAESVPSSVVVKTQGEDSLAGDPQWFMSLDPESVTLHVGSLRSEDGARAFIARHEIGENAFYFAIPKGDDTWYSVFCGVYPTMTLGRGAMALLPPEIRKTRPWLRNIGDVQAMLRHLDAEHQVTESHDAGDS